MLNGGAYELSSAIALPGNTGLEATGLLGAVIKTFRETRRSRALTVISLAVIALMICGLLSPCATKAQVINYPNGFAGSTGQIWLQNGTVLSGSSIQLTNNTNGVANNAWDQMPVNVERLQPPSRSRRHAPRIAAMALAFMIH